MKNKIIEWFRQLLGIPLIESKLETESVNRSLIDGVLGERISKLESLNKIGVDAHFKGQSWAVICTRSHGQDIVKIVEFRNSEAREVLDFMKHFERLSQKRDVPRDMLDLLR